MLYAPASLTSLDDSLLTVLALRRGKCDLFGHYGYVFLTLAKNKAEALSCSWGHSRFRRRRRRIIFLFQILHHVRDIVQVGRIVRTSSNADLPRSTDQLLILSAVEINWQTSRPNMVCLYVL